MLPVPSRWWCLGVRVVLRCSGVTWYCGVRVLRGVAVFGCYVSRYANFTPTAMGVLASHLFTLYRHIYGAMFLQVDLFNILWFFVLLKLLQTALLSLPVPTFDNSQEIYPLVIVSSSEYINGVLQRLIRWDAVYFSSLFVRGPRFEHEWVFGPLWVSLVRFVSNWLLPSSISPILVGIVISNILHLTSALLLFRLTTALYGVKFAMKSTVLFLFSAQGIFMMAPYSENLATALSFLALLLINSKSRWLYLLSTVPLIGAFWTRSNTLVLGTVYLYDFIIKRSPLALVCGLTLALGSLASLYAPYVEYCPGRPWCDSMLPSLYHFAQGEYWNVGLFKYWTLNNLPNFLLGAPVIVLQVLAIKRYYKEHTSLAITNALFLLVITTLAHVQIIIRVSGFLPLTQWYLAEELGHKRGQGWILYNCSWLVIGTLLYSAFLPPA